MTVVVPTYRRPASLQRALLGLRAQVATFDWDVVVVDNDPALTARDVVDAQRAAGLDVRYAHEPATGVAHARNRGTAVAAGDVLAFLDDDVVPCPGWLGAVCAPVLDGAAAATGGAVVLDPSVPRPDWFDEAGIGGYLSAFSLGDADLVLSSDLEYLLTANFAVAADSLARVGGFDPTFGPRGGTQLVADDAHLVRQLRREGLTVMFVPQAKVVHELPAERLTRGYLLRRAYQQGRSDWLLERLEHPGRRFGGARAAATIAGRWWWHELRLRQREGLGRRAVRFHLLCDAVRVAGILRETVRRPFRDDNP